MIHLSKEAYVCQNCKFPNVLDPETNIKRVKRRHPLWVDDFTWFKFKSLGASFKNLGDFLNILLAEYDPERVYEVKAFG